MILFVFSIGCINVHLWSYIIARLFNSVDASVQSHHFLRLIHSKIVAHIGVLQSVSFIFQSKRFELSDRASHNRCKMAEFHKCHDSHERTLTLLLSTNGTILGGHTLLAWVSSGLYQRDDSLSTCLFTLKNPHWIGPIRFNLKSGGSWNSVYCGSDRLVFDIGYDIDMFDNWPASKQFFHFYPINIRPAFCMFSHKLYRGALRP
jgi:hypothetical protein